MSRPQRRSPSNRSDELHKAKGNAFNTRSPGIATWVADYRRVLMFWTLAIIMSVLVFIYGLNDYLYTVDPMNIEKNPQHSQWGHRVSVESTTIRVIAPKDSHSLFAFLRAHSKCDAVREIQIILPDGSDPPKADSYRGTSVKTKKLVYDIRHSTTTEFKNSNELNENDNSNPSTGDDTSLPTLVSPSLQVNTESIMLLDTDMIMTCDDITLAVRTWQGARNSMGVGFFPRLVLPHITRANDDKEKHEYISKVDWIFHGPGQVWWSGAYSLLLPNGLITNTKWFDIMKRASKGKLDDNIHVKISNTPSNNINEATNSVENTEKVLLKRYQAMSKALHDHPYCKDTLEIPLWASLSGATPPIWLDVHVDTSWYPSSPRLSPYQQKLKLQYKAWDKPLSYWWDIFSIFENRGSIQRRTNEQCIDILTKSLDINFLPLSYQRAHAAKNDLLW
jgi:hypothetical protein